MKSNYIILSSLLLACLMISCNKNKLVENNNIILTPSAPANPHINGPAVYGVRPGSPFLYRIPCTGKRPLKFSADNLPSGLSLDSTSGIITGKIDRPGTYSLILHASNIKGIDSRKFLIKAGDTLALTPPMGWNSWYIHYDRVSDKVMREAADQMIASGMADFGYQYINIDDCWMVKVDSKDSVFGGQVRDRDGKILTNKRFPDMPEMTRYIHSKGLKAGIYISPGPRTCGGYEGSFGHEAIDAKTFAGWNFDFLKYDWCSYSEKAVGKTREDYIKPYRIMSDELKRQDRDFVLNLCQYGMGEVWKWGMEVGHSWRTTGDLGLEKGKELPGFYYIGFSNAEHWEYARPGAWNDPDYILIGWVGEANNMGLGTLTTLTPDEQYSYMSMWCLMASPLIFSGDMAKLDPFTLNVLCNSEVIEIDQDILGKQAKILKHDNNEFILKKEMEDGSFAVGIFNLENSEVKRSVSLSELELEGKIRIRDLWRQDDIGIFEGKFDVTIPPHGVSMTRLWKMD